MVETRFGYETRNASPLPEKPPKTPISSSSSSFHQMLLSAWATSFYSSTSTSATFQPQSAAEIEQVPETETQMERAIATVQEIG